MKHTIYLIITIALFISCKQHITNETAAEVTTETTTAPAVTDTATAVATVQQTPLTDSSATTEKKSYLESASENINAQIPENGIYTYKIIDVEFGNQQTGTAKVTINGTHIKIRDSFEGEAYSGELIKDKEYGNGWVIMKEDNPGTVFSIDFNKKEIYYY